MIHQIRRFFDTVTACPLLAEETQRVAAWLDDPTIMALFLDQPVTDQRHSLVCGDYVAAITDRPEMIQAAILHDVGKRHAEFGWLRRSLAGLFDFLRVDASRAIRLYNTHGPIGADELSERGAHPLVVEFARAHHSARPDAITDADWSLLLAADNER